MANYVRNVSHIFHDYNHTRVKCKCFKCMSSVNKLQASSFPFVIKNKPPGIYSITINSKEFVFNLQYALSGDDNVIIYSQSRSTCTINDSTFSIELYQCEDMQKSSNNVYTLNNTVNDIFDCLVFEGQTDLEYEAGMTIQTPYCPAEIKSISEISIKTNSLYKSSGGTLDEEEDTMYIRLKNNIKRVNDSLYDTLVIDLKRKNAYIIYKIGRMELTGTEDIKYMEDYNMNDTLLFFVNCEFASIDNATDHIISNYFTSDTYSNVVDGIGTDYGICLSNDLNNRGFYIRIPEDVIEDVNAFYNIYTCYILKNDKYVKISTLSQKEIDAINPENDDVYVLSSVNKYIKLKTAILDYDRLYKFKKYLSYVYRKNPVTIEYLLAENRYKSELLDEYQIKSFYPKTRLEISSNGNVSIMTKVLN